MLSERFDDENTLSGIGKVPAMQDGKAVEALFKVVAQCGFKFFVEFFVLGILGAPFKRFHFCPDKNEQVTVLKGVGCSCTWDEKSDGIPSFLKMGFKPVTKLPVDFFGFFRQDKNGQAIIPSLWIFRFIK